MICPICTKNDIKNMMLHFLKKSEYGDKQHKKYLDDLNNAIDEYIHLKLYTGEIAEILKQDDEDYNFITNEYIQKRRRKVLGKKAYYTIRSNRMKGDNNPAANEEVKEKIRKTVKGLWESGSYADRINGMLGLCGIKHPQYKPEKHTRLFLAEDKYPDFLSEFQDISICTRCDSSLNKMNVHHVDENHNNILISNMEPLCVPCHTHFHYELQKQPYMTIGREFEFCGSHLLPKYTGKCSYPHGHNWKIQIGVRKRIDKKTGMVLDFSILKNVVNSCIVGVLDHSTLNEIIENPTAENLTVWMWERLMFDGLLKGIHFIKLWENERSWTTLDVEGMLSVFKNKIKNGDI